MVRAVNSKVATAQYTGDVLLAYMELLFLL